MTTHTYTLQEEKLADAFIRMSICKKKIILLSNGMKPDDVDHVMDADVKNDDIYRHIKIVRRAGLDLCTLYPDAFEEQKAVELSYRYATDGFEILSDMIEEFCRMARTLEDYPAVVKECATFIKQLPEAVAIKSDAHFIQALQKENINVEKAHKALTVLGEPRIRSDRSAEEDAIMQALLEKEILQKKQEALRQNRLAEFEQNYAVVVSRMKETLTSDAMRAIVRSQANKNMALLRPQMMHFDQNQLEIASLCFERMLQEYQRDLCARTIEHILDGTCKSTDDKLTQMHSDANEILTEKSANFVTLCVESGINSGAARMTWLFLYNRRASSASHELS
jgi:hypothetical protein